MSREPKTYGCRRWMSDEEEKRVTASPRDEVVTLLKSIRCKTTSRWKRLQQGRPIPYLRGHGRHQRSRR